MKRNWSTLDCLILHTLVLLVIASGASGQTNKYIGRILDSDSKRPIKDANIVIHTTTRGTISNALGYFELNLDRREDSLLVISHIGYKTATIVLPDQDRFACYLERIVSRLNSIDLSDYPKELTQRKELPPPKTPDGLKIVESNAGFNGGLQSFYTYAGNALAPIAGQIPESGIDILFTVNETGNMVDIAVPGAPIDLVKTIATLLSQVPPWIPGTQRGHPVTQRFSMYVLGDNDHATGLRQFQEFVLQNIHYPATALRMGIEGRMFVEFQIDDNGLIHSINPLKHIGAGTMEEMTSVLTKLPKETGMQLRQQTGYSIFLLPMIFSLDGDPRSDSSPLQGPQESLFVLGNIVVTPKSSRTKQTTSLGTGSGGETKKNKKDRKKSGAE